MIKPMSRLKIIMYYMSISQHQNMTRPLCSAVQILPHPSELPIPRCHPKELSFYRRSALQPALPVTQTLDLTGPVITVYQCTPLGQILANTICKETDLYFGVLRELLTAIVTYQHYIKFPWSQVWGSGCQSGEGGIWREKLLVCQKSLGECLYVLDS